MRRGYGREDESAGGRRQGRGKVARQRRRLLLSAGVQPSIQDDSCGNGPERASAIDTSGAARMKTFGRVRRRSFPERRPPAARCAQSDRTSPATQEGTTPPCYGACRRRPSGRRARNTRPQSARFSISDRPYPCGTDSPWLPQVQRDDEHPTHSSLANSVSRSATAVA